MKNTFLSLIILLMAVPLFAQLNTMCGNGDFESGQIDPAEWTGYFKSAGPCNDCNAPVLTQGIVNMLDGHISFSNAHLTIVDKNIDLNDPFILALSTTPPIVAPNPPVNRYSLRIGNSAAGCGHEKIVKTFVVGASDPELRFWYASVMQDPGSNHDCDPQSGDLGKVPGFGVYLFDQSGTDISHLADLGDGTNFNVFDASNNFFVQGSVNPRLFYTDWRCVCVDLTNYINQTVTVEFYNRDCRAGVHYGYTYLDNVCLGCAGSSTGSMSLDTGNDTCALPGQICVNYTLPYIDNTTGEVQINVTLFQNGAPFVTMNSPVLTSGDQYCIDLNNGSLSALNPGLGGFDFTATANFSITNAQNNTTTGVKYLGSEPDGIEPGQNNDYAFVCENDCEKLRVQTTQINPDFCCYSVRLTNEFGPNIAYVEANLISSDWIFSAGATPGAGFAWFGTPGPNSLPVAIHGAGGTIGIPVGIFNDAMAFCIESAVPNPAATQTVVFTWYEALPGGTGFKPVCQDTLTFNCQSSGDIDCLTMQPTVTCNAENPYQYIVNFTVVNNTDFTATHVTLDNLANPLDFGFSACNANNHLASILIPLNPPLPPNTTSGPLCVKISSANPVLDLTVMNFFAGLVTPDDCCSNEEQVSLILVPCCDPCSDMTAEANPLQNTGGQCCFSLDIENFCGYRYFTKVETVILTPGITFGYHALGGPNAADWNVGASTETSILWEMNGGAYIPEGVTTDLIQFCLDGIDQPAELPQLVQLNWITEDQFGKDSIACSFLLRSFCEPVVDYSCLTITNQLLECVPDSSLYCYTFTATNTSDIPFSATNLDLFETTGADLEFIGGGGTFPLPPLAQGDSIRLSVCFEPHTFPLTDSFLVFQYRLRYLMGDTCCYESIRDTLAIPDCGQNPHDCCYPAFIQMPTGLSPNGDGLNDFFVIRGLDFCEHVTLRVFNRWGNEVYQMHDYDNSWDGTNRQQEPLPQGTYYILLTLHDSGSSVAGYVDLRRQ